MKQSQKIFILDNSLQTRTIMDQNCKFLLVAGESSNLYVYNFEDSEFEEHPDRGDLSTGIHQMDLDAGAS